MTDKRSSPRETARIKTRIMVNGQWNDCVVTNISTKGVRLYLRMPVEIGKEASLELPDLGQFDVTVIWSEGNETGLKFVHEPADLSGILQKPDS